MKHSDENIPQAVREHFPDATDQLATYAGILASVGVERGLIGPREVDRLWDRHILNCAVVAQECAALDGPRTVLDIGSGAGLPGLVWSIVAPDLRVTLLDSMKRRTDFLVEAVEALGLGERVNVVRARAEEWRSDQFDVVTARAVAPLSRLVPLAVPHLARGGSIVALKGESVVEEINDAAPAWRRYGAVSTTVDRYGAWLSAPTTVVVMTGF